MQIVKVNLGKDHNINFSGDWHEGTRLQDRGAIDATIDDALKSGSFFIGMGDLAESIAVDDKRYQRELHKSSVVEQYQVVKELIEKVKDQTILHLMGNHDWTLSRRYGNQLEAICSDIGVKFGDYTSAICVYADPEKPISPKHNNDLDEKYFLYKIYVTHGFGTITSRIDSTSERIHSMNRALRRKLFLKMSDCLVMAMGHTHRLVVIPPSSSLDLYIDPSDPPGHQIHSHYTGLAPSEHGYIPPEGRWFVNTGGYLKMLGEGVTGYAEVKGYDPLEIGFPKLICREGKVCGIKRMVLG
jgi:UDP-2,3-diacylglucosamine pyrophosphatase LpxH